MLKLIPGPHSRMQPVIFKHCTRIHRMLFSNGVPASTNMPWNSRETARLRKFVCEGKTFYQRNVNAYLFSIDFFLFPSNLAHAYTLSSSVWLTQEYSYQVQFHSMDFFSWKPVRQKAAWLAARESHTPACTCGCRGATLWGGLEEFPREEQVSPEAMFFPFVSKSIPVCATTWKRHSKKQMLKAITSYLHWRKKKTVGSNNGSFLMLCFISLHWLQES